MKRLLLILGIFAVLSCVAAAQTTGQSLGDVARQLRSHKGPAAGKVYTNDNLPTNAPITILGTAPAPEETDKTKAASAGGEAKGATAKSPDDNAKAQDLQQSLIAEEKKLEFSQRELNVLEGEQKLQASQYYNDAGARLRDPKAYEDEARKYQESIAAKKQEIAAEQQRIDDLQEAIRKAGLTLPQVEAGTASAGSGTSTSATQANDTPAPAAGTSAPENPSSGAAQPQSPRE